MRHRPRGDRHDPWPGEAAGTPRAVARAHLTRVDAAVDMERRYALEVATDLFGGFALARSWGRIGRSCRVRVELRPADAAVLAMLGAQRARTRRRGCA